MNNAPSTLSSVTMVQKRLQTDQHFIMTTRNRQASPFPYVETQTFTLHNDIYNLFNQNKRRKLVI